VESHYDSGAKSSKGAMGIFQFHEHCNKTHRADGIRVQSEQREGIGNRAEIYFSYLLKNTHSVEEALIAWNMGITSTMRLELGTRI
jgi:membrane-bound lytic murein transglycosylase MltF